MGLATHLATPGCSEPSQTPPTPRSCGASHRTPAATLSASTPIDQGATVEFVSDQLGHATTKTTWDIYVHLFRRREHAETARQELNAAFGPMLRSVGQDREAK